VVPPDSYPVSRVRYYSGYRRLQISSATGLSPFVAAVPGYSHRSFSTLCGPTTPESLACFRFGLLPFRSPLLWQSRLISFPDGTEMCHFPSFAFTALWIQAVMTQLTLSRVVPFGDPRIRLCAAPRGLSQLTTSFIASQRQDIPHVRLVT
jgi:hypothetical protein